MEEPVGEHPADPAGSRRSRSAYLSGIRLPRNAEKAHTGFELNSVRVRGGVPLGPAFPGKASLIAKAMCADGDGSRVDGGPLLMEAVARPSAAMTSFASSQGE